MCTWRTDRLWCQMGSEIVQRVCTSIKMESDHDWHQMQFLPGWLYDILHQLSWVQRARIGYPRSKTKGYGSNLGDRWFDHLDIFFARNNEETSLSLLEQYLQEAHLNLTIEVINAGVPGEVYWGSKTDFENNHSKMESEFVILYHGPNDLRQVSTTPMHRHGAHKTHQIGPCESWVSQFAVQSRVGFDEGAKRTGQPFQPLQPHWADKSVTQNMINDLQKIAQQMIQSAQHRRAQPILATHALRAQPGDTGDVARTRVAESARIATDDARTGHRGV